MIKVNNISDNIFTFICIILGITFLYYLFTFFKKYYIQKKYNLNQEQFIKFEEMGEYFAMIGTIIIIIIVKCKI